MPVCVTLCSCQAEGNAAALRVSPPERRLRGAAAGQGGGRHRRWGKQHNKVKHGRLRVIRFTGFLSEMVQMEEDEQNVIAVLGTALHLAAHHDASVLQAPAAESCE